jgi:WD40 repeat protein
VISGSGPGCDRIDLTSNWRTPLSIARIWKRSAARLGLLALAALAFHPEVLAQKKGGGTPPSPAPGLIYFSGWVTTSGNTSYSTPMSMNGDGTDKRNVLSTSSPSYERHANSRWFLFGDYDWDGPVDEWGIPLAYEIYAVNEQDQWVQLTGDPNIHWSGVTGVGSVAWGKDDSFVSYTAWWFTGNGNEVRGGLFYVDIDWTSGVPVAGAPTFLFEADAFWFQNWEASVNLYYHDWSPDGNKVVFEQDDGARPAGTYIANASAPPAQIEAFAGGWNAVWSPDGSRIAYVNGGIWTSNPDGSGAVQLTQAVSTSTQQRGHGSPSWSPDGAFLAYTDSIVSRNKSTYSVMRIPSGGGTPVNLTPEFTKAAGPKWRH